MSNRFLVVILFLGSAQLFAAEVPPYDESNATSATLGDIDTRANMKGADKPLKQDVFLSRFFSDLSLEHRSDQLRTMQNNTTTSVRSFSLGVEVQVEDSFSFLAEVLSDQMVEGDLNVNMGELYVTYSLSDKRSQRYLKTAAGVMKLNYGVLNRQDGQFAVLPSYYALLYDLPRGLDTGVYAEAGLRDSFYMGASGYAGQNLRITDDRLREIDILPHHFTLGWGNAHKTIDISLHYFARKYVFQPYIQGFGLQAMNRKGWTYGHWNLSAESEFWYLESDLNTVSQLGTTGLVAPRLAYKKWFVQPVLAVESWSQKSSNDLRETYLTLKAGYTLNSYLTLMVEKTQIRNTDTNLFRENSFQARLVSQWAF